MCHTVYVLWWLFLVGLLLSATVQEFIFDICLWLCALGSIWLIPFDVCHSPRLSKNQFSVRLTVDCTSPAATESRFGFVSKQSTEHVDVSSNLWHITQYTLAQKIHLFQSHWCKIINYKHGHRMCDAVHENSAWYACADCSLHFAMSSGTKIIRLHYAHETSSSSRRRGSCNHSMLTVYSFDGH